MFDILYVVKYFEFSLVKLVENILHNFHEYEVEHTQAQKIVD